MRSALPLAILSALAVSAFATDAADLRAAVKEDLSRRPYIEPGWIRVRAERGTVTLLGRVPGELEHRIVVLAARNTEGVRLVKDDLEVDTKLARWKPTSTELSRIRVENARKLLRGDEELSTFTTLHVARSRHGLIVSGEVGSKEDRVRVAQLLKVDPDVRVENWTTVRPDASRRAGARASDQRTQRFADLATAAISSETLLAGAVSVRASVERGVLVLRGQARDLLAHDLAFEIARAKLGEWQREQERTRARSGELTRLLAGSPPVASPGDVPDRIESLVVVEGDASSRER